MSLFENFPYTNFHELNLDWIVKIAKDFLDQYTNIQNTISSGIESIEQTTSAGTESLEQTTSEGNESLEQTTSDGNTSLTQTINAGLAAIRNLIDSAYTRNYIIITDSYGTRVNYADMNFYQYLIALGVLSADRSYFRASPGAGFYHSDPTNTFTALLQDITVQDPTKITDIYVVCGANDNYHTAEQIVAGLNSFRQYANATYPLARLWLFPCGLTLKPTDFITRDSVTLTMFREAGRQGFNYIPNAEYVLCNSKYLESDRCHPNTTGVNVISFYLASAIYTGSCSVRHTLDSADVNTTISVTGTLNPSTAIVHSSSGAAWTSFSKNSEFSFVELVRAALVFNLNDVSINENNTVIVTMDNIAGLPCISKLQKCIFKGGAYTDTKEVIGTYTISYNTSTNKYEVIMRPNGTISSGTGNNIIEIYLLSDTFTM